LVYDKLAGFSGFGFPKSHAAAFGLLAYQSTWLRYHHPREFLAALLNAQPMGFYPPASLVRDAQRRGVEVRPVDVNRSAAKCGLDDDAVRIGLEYVQSLGEPGATPELPEQTPWERMLADYRLTSLSVGTHPLALLRPRLPEEVVSSRDLGEQPHGGRIAVAGLAVARQRPSTANGVVFMLLEDEF